MMLLFYRLKQNRIKLAGTVFIYGISHFFECFYRIDYFSKIKNISILSTIPSEMYIKIIPISYVTQIKNRLKE